MKLLENWVMTPVAAALAKTLLHSIWEGAVVALALAVVLLACKIYRGLRGAGRLVGRPGGDFRPTGSRATSSHSAEARGAFPGDPARA